MPITIEIETFNEFAARHGGAFKLDRVQGEMNRAGEQLWHFPDGARCLDEVQLRPSQRWEPSEDPKENLRERLRYLKLAVPQEEAYFDRCRGALISQANNAKQSPLHCAPPTDHDVEQLDVGAKRLAKLRKELAKLQREVGKESTGQKNRAHLETVYDNAATEVDRVMAKINAIEV